MQRGASLVEWIVVVVIVVAVLGGAAAAIASAVATKSGDVTDYVNNL
jgi:Tfp pilus assembly protein PilE